MTRVQGFQLPVGDEIYALTLHQPFATLITRRQKLWETRSWTPSSDCIHSLFAIHAGKTRHDDLIKGDDAIRRRLIVCERLPPDDGHVDDLIPTGGVLAIAELMMVVAAPIAKKKYRTYKGVGDFSEGRYAWRFDVRYVYEQPVPARGHQRVWLWDVVEDPAKDH